MILRISLKAFLSYMMRAIFSDTASLQPLHMRKSSVIVCKDGKRYGLAFSKEMDWALSFGL